jgi:hypothetical protein
MHQIRTFNWTVGSVKFIVNNGILSGVTHLRVTPRVNGSLLLFIYFCEKIYDTDSMQLLNIFF